MDKNKTTTSKSPSFPQTDAPRAFSEMAEMSAMQSQEAYKKMSAASTETAHHQNQFCDCTKRFTGLQ
jgi:hypothetical protein